MWISSPQRSFNGNKVWGVSSIRITPSHPNIVDNIDDDKPEIFITGVGGRSKNQEGVYELVML